MAYIPTSTYIYMYLYTRCMPDNLPLLCACCIALLLPDLSAILKVIKIARKSLTSGTNTRWLAGWLTSSNWRALLSQEQLPRIHIRIRTPHLSF